MVQFNDVSARELYRPGEHSEQTPAPAALKDPGPQGTAVALVDPGGQEYPALHAPVQDTLVPPMMLLYSPAAHWEQDAAPASAYWPIGHSSDVALVEPGGHA